MKNTYSHIVSSNSSHHLVAGVNKKSIRVPIWAVKPPTSTARGELRVPPFLEELNGFLVFDLSDQETRRLTISPEGPWFMVSSKLIR